MGESVNIQGEGSVRTRSRGTDSQWPRAGGQDSCETAAEVATHTFAAEDLSLCRPCFFVGDNGTWGPATIAHFSLLKTALLWGVESEGSRIWIDQGTPELKKKAAIGRLGLQSPDGVAPVAWRTQLTLLSASSPPRNKPHVHSLSQLWTEK